MLFLHPPPTAPPPPPPPPPPPARQRWQQHVPLQRKRKPLHTVLVRLDIHHSEVRGKKRRSVFDLGVWAGVAPLIMHQH